MQCVFSPFFLSNLTPSWSNSKFWYIVSFTSQISLFSSRLFSLYSKSNVSISFLWIWFCRSINLSMKEGSLFCFVVMRSTEPGCFRSWSWSLWKALAEEGCMGLVPWRLDLWCKSSWILNDFFTEKKLNHNWKFQRNWNVPLVLLERSWWAGLHGIHLLRFGLRMWGILILKWFLPLKIQINSKKPGFGKEKSVEDVVTLGPMAQATLVVFELEWWQATNHNITIPYENNILHSAQFVILWF